MAWAADADASAAASLSGCASGRRKEREERKAGGAAVPVAPHSPGGLHSSPPAPPSLTEGFVLPLCSVPPPLQMPAGSSAPAAPRPPAGPYFLRAGGASEPGAKGLTRGSSRPRGRAGAGAGAEPVLRPPQRKNARLRRPTALIRGTATSSREEGAARTESHLPCRDPEPLRGKVNRGALPTKGTGIAVDGYSRGAAGSFRLAAGRGVPLTRAPTPALLGSAPNP